MAAAPAEQPETQDSNAESSNVVPIREGEPIVGVDRKAEGGLTVRFAFDLPKVPSVMTVQTWTHQQMINGGLLVAVALMAAFLIYQYKFKTAEAVSTGAVAESPVRANVHTDFNPEIDSPVIAPTAYIDRLASVIGYVQIGGQVYVAPFASIRGDEGQPIVIGEGSNVQDGVVLHALETFDGSKVVEGNLVTVDGKKYAVWIGKNVSMAHQSQVHGPALVGDNTFVGMQSLVFKAQIGSNVVIEPGAKVIGVKVADGRYIPAGTTVTTQAAADALPTITESYAFAKLNNGVLEVNHEFADAYKAAAAAAEGGAGGEPAAHEPEAAAPAASGH